MKKIIFYWLGILFLALLLPGCSDDDNAPVITTNPGNQDAPAAVTVTSSKDLVLADSTDSVVIRATVNKEDGTAVDDGTTVTFELDSDGNLSAASATTTNGVASVDLSHDPLPAADNQIITVTCGAGTVTGSTTVKFINQPASADVFIAFDQAVTDLAALQFVLKNTDGATFSVASQHVSAINNGSEALVAANFAAGSNTVGLSHATGFDTGTLPFIRLTYAVSSGLPEFSVDPAFTAVDPGLGATTPPVTAANLVVEVTYDTNA